MRVLSSSMGPAVAGGLVVTVGAGPVLDDERHVPAGDGRVDRQLGGLQGRVPHIDLAGGRRVDGGPAAPDRRAVQGFDGGAGAATPGRAGAPGQHVVRAEGGGWPPLVRDAAWRRVPGKAAVVGLGAAVREAPDLCDRAPDGGLDGRIAEGGVDHGPGNHAGVRGDGFADVAGLRRPVVATPADDVTGIGREPKVESAHRDGARRRAGQRRTKHDRAVPGFPERDLDEVEPGDGLRRRVGGLIDGDGERHVREVHLGLAGHCERQDSKQDHEGRRAPAHGQPLLARVPDSKAFTDTGRPCPRRPRWPAQSASAWAPG